MCIQTEEAHSERKKNTTNKQKKVYIKVLLFKAVFFLFFLFFLTRGP